MTEDFLKAQMSIVCLNQFIGAYLSSLCKRFALDELYAVGFGECEHGV